MPSILVQIVMSAAANTHGKLDARPSNTSAACYRVADDDYKRRQISECVNEVAATTALLEAPCVCHTPHRV